MPLGTRLFIWLNKSIHYVIRIVINAELNQNVRQFFLKRHMAMVLTLVLNVRLDCWQLGAAIGECAIASLP